MKTLLDFKKTLSCLIFFLGISAVALAQQQPVAKAPEKAQTEEPATEEESKGEALNLVSAGYAGNGAAPKINLKTYKFKALIGSQEFDFYLFNSVPSIVPKLQEEKNNTTTTTEDEPAKRYLSNDILQQVGGLLNISLGKVAFFGYGGDEDMKYVKGVQMDIRLGGKLLEAPFAKKSEFFPALQSYFDLRYLIPLVDTKLRKKGNSYKESMVGNLSFRLVGAVQQFFTNRTGLYEQWDAYTRFFTTYSNNTEIFPNKTLISGNFEALFYLTNKVYISAGYFFSNDKLIDSYPFFSLSYGGK
jgi:hypothetical protein